MIDEVIAIDKPVIEVVREKVPTPTAEAQVEEDATQMNTLLDEMLFTMDFDEEQQEVQLLPTKTRRILGQVHHKETLCEFLSIRRVPPQVHSVLVILQLPRD